MRSGIHFRHPDEAELLRPEAASLRRFHLFGPREAAAASAGWLGCVRQRPRPVGSLRETSDGLDDRNRVRALWGRCVLGSAAVGKSDLRRQGERENESQTRAGHLTAKPLAGTNTLLSPVRVAFTRSEERRVGNDCRFW